MAKPSEKALAAVTPGAGRLRALVVDDRGHVTGGIADYLHHEEFVVHVSGSHNAREASLDFDPDVVVLHLARRDGDALEVSRQLRELTNAYVVLLSARDAEVVNAVGLPTVDHHIATPLSHAELVTRIRNTLRRPSVITSAATDFARPGSLEAVPQVFGPLHIDIAGRHVQLDGTSITLTRTEFDVLAALSSRPGVVFTRKQLLAAVWGDSRAANGNTDVVDVHVGHLRRKLGDDPSQPRYVKTVRGIGYRLGIGR